MISRSIFSVASSRLISAAITFLTSLFLINELSVTKYGELFFWISLITFFSTLPNIGINNFFVYNNEKSTEIDSWIYTKLVVFLGSLLVFMPLSYFIYNGAMYAVLIGLLFSLFDTVLTTCQAQQRFKIYSILLPAKNAVLLFFLFIFSKEKVNLDFLHAYCLTAFLFSIPFVLLLFKNFPPKKIFSMELIKGAKGFFLFELFALIIIRSETWIIKLFESLNMIDAKTLGVYGIVFGLCSGLSIVSNSIQSVLLPKIKSDPASLYGERLKVLYIYAFLFGFSYYFMVNLFLFFYKEEVLSLSLVCSAVVIVGMCASFISSLLRLRLVNSGKDKALNIIYVIQLLLTFLLGSICILSWGAVGAAVSFALVRVSGLLLMTNLTRENHVF